MTSFESVLNQPRVVWLRENAWNVDKRILLLLGILLWLHGVTVGIVFEGQKGLLNRFLWTFVVGLLPCVLFVKYKSWRRTAVILLYFELATFIMCCSNSIAWYRNPKNLKPLPDVGHDILPEWKHIQLINPRTKSIFSLDTDKFPDLVMGILAISTLLFAISHPKRRSIFHRFFIVYGTLCIMRSVSVITTSLPDSAETCRQITPTGNLSSGAHRWADITFREVTIRSLKLLVPVGEVTCGDMVFSGHSMLMVLCAMTWHTYYKWVPGFVNYTKVAIWIITLFGLTSIVWVRMHYSLDVVLALYFTVTVWSSYHRIANDVIIGHRFSAVWVFDALVVYPFIEWVEMPDIVEPQEDEEVAEGEDEKYSSEDKKNSSLSPTSPLRRRRQRTKRSEGREPGRKRYNFRSRSCHSSYTRMELKYEILDRIGNGAFGQVYKVKEKDSKRKYAAKTIRIGPNGIPENPFREMKAMQELQHPHIVQLIDVLPHGSELALIMEYMETDLMQILRQTPGLLQPREIKTILNMVLKGLAYCHKYSIMHRDMKPSNLLLDRDGQVKICDFGLARVFNQRSNSKNYTHQVATRWYRAPELLFASREYSCSVDLWAVGAIFGEMLLGRPLFPGDNDINQIVSVFKIRGSILREWPDAKDLPDYDKVSFPDYPKIPMHEVISEASDEALDLLEQLLSYDPAKRISAEEALLHDYFFTDPLPQLDVQELLLEFQLTRETFGAKSSKCLI